MLFYLCYKINKIIEVTKNNLVYEGLFALIKNFVIVYKKVG